MSVSKILGGVFATSALIGAIATPALGQFGQRDRVPRAGWVELRDANQNLRGFVQILGDGSAATVIFRDANGTPIDSRQPRSEALPPLLLAPLPNDEKADASTDVKLLREQIRVLDQNVQALKNAVYGRR